ncbi:endothelial cell-specific chemotaxis regulator isoform X1 [Sinocyclocheilus rhinocerous]|uniref:endothelial cell-specific chemotaxis regulator isoform X1 n=1 Tax=Sinocyclocheilus rhinocerous TaxID=307959 RepID=UPI0007BACDDE|nr:PREDICTED: endothelial cell-specific chemotaxis regulator-like isoform X1 [Sinocyclocheilus rhinocerous]
MEQLFFLLIPLFASSSIISAGNDPSIPTTVPPNTTAMSPWSVVSRTEVQTEKTVSTTTAPVYSSHTGSTDGSSLSSHTTSGQSIITSSMLTTLKSYTDTTLNSTSSPAAKITGSTDGSGLSSHNTSVGVSLLPKTSTTANSNISMSEVTATPSQAPDSGLTLLAFGVMSLILILIVVMVVLVTAINLRGRCRNTKQHEGIKSCDSVVSDSNMTSNCEKESITLVSVRTINTENNTDSPQMSSVRSTIVDNDDQEFTRDLLGIKDGL